MVESMGGCVVGNCVGQLRVGTVQLVITDTTGSSV